MASSLLYTLGIRYEEVFIMQETTQKNNLTEIVFILDRSGSMAGLEADTIGGFNGLIQKQKSEDGEAIISTVLFDDKSEVLYDRVPLDSIPAMTEKDYYVRGCTALLDAVGSAIHHIGIVHKYARPEDRPAKTLFIITTDGMENSSKRYTYEQVKSMIERQKEKYGWEFLFLGANIDAISVANRFGIDENHNVYDRENKNRKVSARNACKTLIYGLTTYDIEVLDKEETLTLINLALRV
jgi:uncharacterized protein YegL